jgi:hypothetical protein
VIIRIVDEQHIDAVESETAEALVHRAHHAIIAEIKLRPLGGRALVVSIFRSRSGRSQQTPDLGRDRE